MSPLVEMYKRLEKDAQYCRIDRDKIYLHAYEDSKRDFVLPSWRQFVFPKDNRAFVEFIGLYCVLNYCLIDFYLEKRFGIVYPRGTILRGDMALAGCLKRALDYNISLFDEDVIAYANRSFFEELFRGREMEIPLLNRRIEDFRNILRSLKESPFNSFYDLFEKSDFRLFGKQGGIISNLIGYFEPYRQDLYYWKDGQCFVQFFRRPQLLSMMYHGRAIDSGGELPLIKDPEYLGPIFSDRVLKTQRENGELVFSDELVNDIDSRRTLPRGSRKEIEIRMMSALAMTESHFFINAYRPKKSPITMAHLHAFKESQGACIGRRQHYTYTTEY